MVPEAQWLANLRMRSNPDIVCREATIEPQWSLLSQHPLEAVEHAIVR